MLNIAGFQVLPAVVLLGVVSGLTYGVLAVGVILVYRASRTINFAYGQIGALGAALLGTGVMRWHVPYWLMFGIALAISAGVGGASEVSIVRRLRKAPVLMTVVATLGLGQVLLGISLSVNSGGQTTLYPQPPGLPTFTVGHLLLTPAYTGMLILTPVLLLLLVVFLRRSSLGIAIRAAADNPEAARLAGVPAGAMSTAAWALAGAVAAYAAIFLYPTLGYITAFAFGPGLLLRALVAGVIARMNNLPVALGAGILIGVVEQELLYNSGSTTSADAVLFVAVLVVLLLQRRGQGRGEDVGSWVAVALPSRLPEAYSQVWLIRHLSQIGVAFMILIGLALPLVVSNGTAFGLTTVIAFVIVGLSLVILTGLAGQLSLGQFTFAALGATVSAIVANHTSNYPLAFLAGGVTGAAIAILIGVPALRIKGLLLTVTTLGFALMSSSWLLQQKWMIGAGLIPGHPSILGHAVTTGRTYYYVALVVLLACTWLAWNVKRGGLARNLIATRDNEDAARAFAVPVLRRKLQAFALAGFIAGLGGAVYGHALPFLASNSFPVDLSINAVAVVALGGVTSLVGPFLGAAYVIGLPTFVQLAGAAVAAASMGWLVVVLWNPGGLPVALRPRYEGFVRFIARSRGVDVDETQQEAAREELRFGDVRLVAPAARPALEPGKRLLTVTDVTKSYGGVAALKGVSLDVAEGEVVGLIGPNGAGKTTLFEVISGFVPADTGAVVLAGRSLRGFGPEGRARLGLIRSFQDSHLFPTMSVLETVMLSYERLQPTTMVDSILGLATIDRYKERAARDLIGMIGLDRYRHTQIRELSTGTRRITELACMIACQPRLLLLDEPSSGIAQRETEQLGELLQRIRSDLACTLLVIEHDIPMVMGLADRIVAMESGSVLCVGPPEVVRLDSRVLESCLGPSALAVQRSGALVPAPAG